MREQQKKKKSGRDVDIYKLMTHSSWLHLAIWIEKNSNGSWKGEAGSTEGGGHNIISN
jgi:hypothetical protein